MVESNMPPIEGPLLRARLHIRGGLRRIRQGKVKEGVVTLGDALSAAMEYCVDLYGANLSHDERHDERAAYMALVRTGLISGRFDYDSFQQTVDQALAENTAGYEPHIEALEALMLELRIMPLDEKALPPEDPETF